MIPSILAAQVRRGVEEFLLTTFPITNPYFAGRLEAFLSGPGAVFRGPYLSIRLPFLPGDPDRRMFPDVVPEDFEPHRHQQQAWERLASPGARSTLVATGTGSGKTECFLYPVLDHCLRNAGRKGIKAIIVYPMNALATDQARRLAAAIHDNPRLRGLVTAGLYIGGRQDDGPGTRAMSATEVITDRDTLRLAPPDVLLTNYKMLDYLLVRPEDYPLWRENGPETLKYFVVDELHSFDGAQAADLACLIRRIKERVKAPPGHICAVGTSATLGEGSESANRQVLVDYARRVFGEPFDANSIVGESVLTADQFLAGRLVTRLQPPEAGAELDPQAFESVEDYLRTQHRLWFDEDIEIPPGSLHSRQHAKARAPRDGGEGADEGDDDRRDGWRVKLGARLQEHAFFRNLLLVLGNRAVDEDTLLDELAKSVPSFGRPDRAHLRRLLESFLALLSVARVERHGRLEPLVHVRCQLWLRELRRMVSRVSAEPSLAFADDLPADEAKHALPLIHCRECGIAGWGGVLRHGDTRLNPDLQAFYRAFFNNSTSARFLWPGIEFAGRDGQRVLPQFLCANCLSVFHGESGAGCATCGAAPDKVIPVGMPDATREVERDGTRRREGSHDCPACQGRNSLTILGSRAASLTAVIIAQLYSSPYNDDKKLLAFSDSVQDASHRRGFFGARTFKFNLRSALQKVVDEMCGEVPFTDLAREFIERWRARMGDRKFVATFLPPDMDWLEEYERLRETGDLPAGGRLLDRTSKRIDWEIWSEYGFDARIGRTLEKTGSSVLAADPQTLQRATDSILPRLQNEIGPLRDLEGNLLRRLLAGLVVALKNKGAIEHPETGRYLDSGGNSWLLGKQGGPVYMPYFGRGMRSPVFVTNRAGTRFNTWVRSAQTQTPTWYEDYLARLFAPLDPEVGRFSDEAFRIIVRELVQNGILFERSTPKGVIWGLRREIFRVTNRVVQFRCRACSSSVSAAEDEAEWFDAAACLRYRCAGTLERQPGPGAASADRSTTTSTDDYYRRLYSRGDVARVFAEEHTGLLDRATRERIERDFQQGGRPGDPNLLSCTPTLEMGINIGDLSSLALCSIPPKPSNYLQRAGRAGRRDGNAFILAVANARPHDLFFFFEPGQMIQGHVEPPGCFLGASAVLERQLTGYVFDRWIESGLPPGSLPKRLGPVLDQVDRWTTDSADRAARGRDAFPANFIRFFETKRTSLEHGFLQMFGDELQPFARERILAFARGSGIGDQPSRGAPDGSNKTATPVTTELRGLRTERPEESPTFDIRPSTFDGVTSEGPGIAEQGSGGPGDGAPGLVWRLMNGLGEQARERKSLRNRVKALTTRISEAQKEPGAGESQKKRIEQLREEKAALNAVIREINDRHLLNFFTDEGLLPNYAFPESGVVLRSVIYRRREAAEGDRRYDARAFTYERPAASAIVELAPANSFHAEGRKVLIDQVSLDLSEIEPWRFCDSCSYMERDVETERRRDCPQCGSPLWGDEGQRRLMLRMRQVIATTSEKQARSYDEADDREPAFYQKNLFVLKKADDATAAWFVDNEEVPFGFEFFRKITLREVNFGREHGERGAFRVAGHDVVDNPFVVCRSCGKVRGLRREADHAVSCPWYTRPEREKVFESCFLYREFVSEGVRMLLPVATFDADVNVHSFVAALELGLRKRFSGDPGHLLTTVYEEPVQGSTVRKQYLVLYDGVPGGTGYLKELMQDERALMDVFQSAYDVLALCPCGRRDPEKDGCYRCLLSYRGRHHMGNTSRRAAMGMLARLLANRDRLRVTDRLDRIGLNSLLESELEERFVEALRRAVDRRPDAAISRQVVNGKPGWHLRIGHASYLVEPQVPLGAAENVSVPARADFVIHPERCPAGSLPVALFTDGYEYHADPASPHRRLGLDSAQRLAIIRSGRFRVWSLTWDDVAEGLGEGAEPGAEVTGEGWAGAARVLRALDGDHADWWRQVREARSFDALLMLLEHPERAWPTFSGALLAGMTARAVGCSEEWALARRTQLLSPDWPAPGDTASGKSPAGATEAHGVEAWSSEAAPAPGGGPFMQGSVRRPEPEAPAAVAGFVFGDARELKGRDLSGLTATFRLLEPAAASTSRDRVSGGTDLDRPVLAPGRGIFRTWWRAWLRALNFLQFTPRVEFVSCSGLRDGLYGGLLGETLERGIRPQTGPQDHELEALVELVAPEVRPLVVRLRQMRLALPEAGYELTDGSGRIVATAELAWPESRVAVLVEQDLPGRGEFARQGWTTLTAADCEAGIETLVAALGA